ncbi:hypothetical protein VTN00DRAFT_6728 [Thermoascus crustaceus]|uniref:uncharacterized protein n=1 Tax=Thermoascus crustaceus TaxID=5088 RepID=UPI00374448F6
MAGERGQSFFKAPKETLDLFADLVESEDELPPKSLIPTAASTKERPPCLTLSSDDESPVSSSTVGFSNGHSQTSDRSAHRFSPYKPAKRDEQTRSLPRVHRNPITPSPPIPAIEPSSVDTTACTTAREDANIVTRSDTGGKTVTKQHVRDLTPKHPKKGGKMVHPALLVPLEEEIDKDDDDCEDGDEDEDRDSDSGDNDDDAEVPNANNTNEASSSSKPPKEGSEHTSWRYHVVQQNDTAPRATQTAKSLAPTSTRTASSAACSGASSTCRSRRAAMSSRL